MGCAATTDTTATPPQIPHERIAVVLCSVIARNDRVCRLSGPTVKAIASFLPREVSFDLGTVARPCPGMPIADYRVSTVCAPLPAVHHRS